MATNIGIIISAITVEFDQNLQTAMDCNILCLIWSFICFSRNAMQNLFSFFVQFQYANLQYVFLLTPIFGGWFETQKPFEMYTLSASHRNEMNH